jgi:hypothetical protein
MFTRTALRTSNVTWISKFDNIFRHYVIHVYVNFGRCSLFVLRLILSRFSLFIPYSILLLITLITPHNGPLFLFFLCYLLFLHLFFYCIFLLNLLLLLLVPLYFLLFPFLLNATYVALYNFLSCLEMKKVGSSNNDSGLYEGGDRFESRSGDRLSWLKCFVDFLSSGKYWDSTSN